MNKAVFCVVKRLRCGTAKWGSWKIGEKNTLVIQVTEFSRLGRDSKRWSVLKYNRNIDPIGITEEWHVVVERNRRTKGEFNEFFPMRKWREGIDI